MEEDIDKMLESFPRTPYSDGWAEDKWREEIEKHPFFMTDTPDPTKELPPLIDGLQQLKYSEEENTPDELAKTYKDDGNFYFKCKKYRDAVSHYSAGLKLNCSDDLKAQLFNNRSASNYFLQNFRSSLNDCEETLKLDSNYKKAKLRKAQCLFHLENYDECIETCDDILSQLDANVDVIKLRKDAVQKKKLKDRNERKGSRKKELEDAEENELMRCIKERNIRFVGKKNLSLSNLNPDSSISIPLSRVYLKNGKLFWPVIYSFPEIQLNMPINEFDEDLTFGELLNVVSEGMNEYDSDGKFTLQQVRIFFQDKNEKLVEFSIHCSLRNILSSERFVLRGPIVLFFLLLKESAFTKKYLNTNEHIPLCS